jgi:hypothetical protein
MVTEPLVAVPLFEALVITGVEPLCDWSMPETT